MKNVTDRDRVIKGRVRIAVAIVIVAVSTLYFSGDILRWFEYPYKVQHELDLDGFTLSGDRPVECVLRRGDLLHYVGESDVKPGTSLTVNLMKGWIGGLHYYTVELLDASSEDCVLDTRGILLWDSDVDSARLKDKERWYEHQEGREVFWTN